MYVIRAVMLNFIAFKRPSFEFQFSALAGHLNMSGALLARRSGELIAKSFENALYERIFGAASLGSYSVATQVTRFGCDLFMNPPIGSLYAFAIRNEERNVRALHFKIFRYLSFVLIPGVALAVAIAPSLFSLVLSDNWSLAALIFQPLALGYAFTALSGLNDAVLMSGNKTWRATIPALSAAIGRIFAVSAGFWFSPVIVAWLVCFLFIAQAIWLILGTPRSLAFGLHVLFRTWASASFCAVVVYIVCSALLDIGDGPAFLGIAILGGVVSWFLTVFGFLHKEIRSHAAPFIRNNFFRR
ncbi:oligosaccharide flippase family protein [Methylobacterium sp. WL7]|nr:oligosaccharide flippase family protein [Methylobacterium sp. WL7]